jgi:hypothetical protein
MSQAIPTHTTPMPRPRISGAVPCDADLLAAAAEFELSGDRLDWINGDDSNLTEEECDAELDRWYAALERIAALTPRTLKGWRAKATAAYKALASTAPIAGARLDREQQLALEVFSGSRGLVESERRPPARAYRAEPGRQGSSGVL